MRAIPASVWNLNQWVRAKKRKPAAPPAPRPTRRCSMCGNETRTFAPVFGGWLTCVRCTDVIRDRTRNMANGQSLLRDRRTLWTDGTES